jgi:hypothetical protein
MDRYNGSTTYDFDQKQASPSVAPRARKGSRHPKKSHLTEHVKHGGQWCVIHSDRNYFSDQVSGYLQTESEALAEKEKLSLAYPSNRLHIHRVMTVAEVREEKREDKKNTKLWVSFYQIMCPTLCRAGDKFIKVSDLGSRMYGGRFKAIRALRKARQNNPGAYLTHATRFFSPSDSLAERADLVRRIVR